VLTEPINSRIVGKSEVNRGARVEVAFDNLDGFVHTLLESRWRSHKQCVATYRGTLPTSGDYWLADQVRHLREDGLDRAAWRGLLRSYRA
jgi:hypothetical protein